MKTMGSVKIWLFMITLLWVIMMTSGCSNSNIAASFPSAKQGILNLKDVNLHEHEPLKLQGDWEFYWDQLLSPEDFDGILSDPVNYIKLPHSWNNYMLGEEQLPGSGYATFRLNILLDENMVNQELALKMQNINYSYKLWIEDVLVTEVGKVGTDRDSTVPKITTELIPFYSTDQSIEVVIQVANFHHKRGGIANHILLGTSEQLITQTNLKIASDLFITGSIISIGIYHIMLFWSRRKDQTPLFFGLFCLIWGIRTLFVGEVILTKIFPAFPWELELKLEYLALFMGPHIFARYIQSMYPNELPSLFYRVSRFITIIFSLIAIFTPAIIFTHTLLAFEIYTVIYLFILLASMIMAVLHKREGALLICVASAFGFLTVVNDFLYYAEKLLIGNLSPLGLFIFTLAQMYILSNRFANAFTKVEEVSYELQETNQKLCELARTLEEKVNIRTLQLEKSNQSLRETNKELVQLQDSRRKLLSYITHDLKSPITTIIGYAKVVLDKVNPEKSDTYLKYIHDKTMQLNQMLNDLHDLSQLENRTFSFQMREVLIGRYLQKICDKYELFVTDAKLHFRLKMVDQVENVVLKMDPDRIEQVLYNLISNSVKFTKPGGEVTIDCHEHRDHESLHSAVLIKITDTGIGITEESISYIFERNYKEYPEELINKEGSGLGLSICREIIEAHGGMIWAESTPNVGTSLCFTLPFVSEEEINRKENMNAD